MVIKDISMNKMIWIEKFYNNCNIFQKIGKTFLFFIFPMVIIFIPFFIFRGTFVLNFNIGRRLALLSAGSWGFVGPLCIQYYFKKIRSFDSFVDTVKSKEEEHKSYLENFLLTYKKAVFIISVLWGLAIVVILLFFKVRLEDYAFYGFTDIYYWILILYCVFMAHLQAYGFAGLMLVVLIIIDCFKSKTLLKNILLNDFGCGIKKIGNLIVITCICFGTGALYFPILISFAHQGSNLLKWATYSLVLVFALALFLFFLISFLVIKSYAKKSKGDIVNEIKTIYESELCNSINSNNGDNDNGIRKELHIKNLHERLLDLEGINVNPVDIQGISATVLTIFIPVALYIRDIIKFLTEVL